MTEHPWAKHHRAVFDPPEPWFDLEKQLVRAPEEKVPQDRKKCEPVSDAKI